MFDILTYEKGASVLRMLEQHIGPTVFRDGVRQYLRTHAYDNADTKDLWLALGRAARQDIDELLNAWIFEPGYPLLTASLNGPSSLGHRLSRGLDTSRSPSAMMDGRIVLTSSGMSPYPFPHCRRRAGRIT